MDIAEGEYIGFVDSDDFICPQMIEIMLKIMDISGSDMSVCKAYQFTNENEVKCGSLDVAELLERVQVYSSKYVLDNFDKFYYKKIRPGVWCKLYKKRIFENIRFKKGIIFEDLDLLFDIVDSCNKIVCIDDELYYYRQREGSILNSAFNARKFSCLDIFEKLIGSFYESGRNPGILLQEYMCNYCVFSIITNVYFPKYKDILRKYTSQVKNHIIGFISNPRIGVQYKVLLIMSLINWKFTWRMCKKFRFFTSRINYWHRKKQEK